MNFTLNNQEWTILLKDQQDFDNHGDHTKEDGYFFGQSHFNYQEIWLDKSLKHSKIKNTLYHELMHVYLKTYVTNGDCSYDEESLCDLSANSHDIIHNIAQKYMHYLDSIRNK